MCCLSGLEARMRRLNISSAIVVTLGFLATVGLTACSASAGPSTAGPGSGHAYDPATDTYWALGTFEPTAPDSNPAWYQDGTSTGMFQKVGAGPWQVHITLSPLLCGELRFFPPAVLTTWALPTAPPDGFTC
jgi:hypothetical protein